MMVVVVKRRGRRDGGRLFLYAEKRKSAER